MRRVRLETIAASELMLKCQLWSNRPRFVRISMDFSETTQQKGPTETGPGPLVQRVVHCTAAARSIRLVEYLSSVVQTLCSSNRI